MSAVADNRAAFPETAKLVDALRDAFGEGMVLVWAVENGREIGKRGAVGVPAIMPLPLQKNNRRGGD